MTEKWLSDEELTAKIAALEENYKIVTEKVAQAAIKSGRKPEEITLLAATKTVPVPVINRAIELGITCIGENKVQELCEKYDQLHLEHCDCHFIGHLQTNKVKQLIGKVSMIHSVDSVKPVSYTHLDVYKRQALEKARRSCRSNQSCHDWNNSESAGTGL